MINELITSLKDLLTVNNINNFIKAGEDFYKEFCQEILEYSKNDDLDNIKAICLEISRIDAEWNYLSNHFNNSSSSALNKLDELEFVKSLLSRILGMIHIKAEDKFIKLNNSSQISQKITQAYNNLISLCRNLINIDLNKLTQGLNKFKFALSDIDMEDIINLLNSITEPETTHPEIHLDRYALQSFIIHKAENASLQAELKLIIPLLFYL